MPSNQPPLAGLRSVTGWLLEHMLDRPDGRSRKLPIVVALGPRGSGKTALLRTAERRAAMVPHAYLDFHRYLDIDGRDHLPPREVLGKLAFGLSKDVKQFGRLAFPRLWLCLMVVGSSVHINAGDRRQALAELRGVLQDNQPVEQNREDVMRLVEFAGEVASGQQLPGWAAPVTDLLLSGLGRVERWRMLRRIQKLSSAQGNAEDVLIDIAGWADDGDGEDERAEADAIFYEAFLTDLQRAYSGVNRMRRTMNCVVLLDNVHTDSGRRFLFDLQRARQRGDDDGDPMVVFATSRTWIPYWDEGWHHPGGHHLGRGEVPLPPTYRTGGHTLPTPRRSADIDDDWRRAEPGELPWNPWYLLDISRLAAADVVSVAAEFGHHPRSRVTEFVQHLTAGHPGGVVDVLTATAGVIPGSETTDLRGALDLPTRRSLPEGEDGAAGPCTLGAAILRELLQDFDSGAQRDLVTASAARNVDLLYHPEVLDSPAPHGEELLEHLRNNLWVRERGGAEPDFEIDPWLRRLLLHALAARDASDPLNWKRTHAMCRDIYEHSGRPGAARYHDLALGNLDAVIAYLRAPLDSHDIEFDVPAAESWLTDLDLITSAPNALGRELAPGDLVAELVGRDRDELGESLGWLIAALWIAHDPLGDPQRKLDTTIENQFRHLAIGRGRGAMLLYERGERYR
ncbi:hypothetical protein [Nocardia wallacei]|uniref:hypothetical protein n=1 Tax=Nocardia wallacei TaxID=480035 RepID=UPI0024579558|nr:hypothetical protein [Nocardia wallacei]